MGGGAARWRRADITRAGADQFAMLQLLAGMRDPAHRARHRKQHQFMARRHAERMHQHRQGVVDIDEFAGRFRDAIGNFPGKFFRSAGAVQGNPVYRCF